MVENVYNVQEMCVFLMNNDILIYIFTLVSLLKIRIKIRNRVAFKSENK